MAAVGKKVKANDTEPESQLTDYLINGNFFLTALEFHYELLERGISCSTLEEFLSNAENFYKLDLNQPEFLSISNLVFPFIIVRFSYESLDPRFRWFTYR